MIEIFDEVIKEQKNFWSGCVFHPTDAVEDAWGKRILDAMAIDGGVKTIRIYTMFEDIVYLDEKDELQFDFRLSDLRLDYLLEKGYQLLLSYGGVPDCIAQNDGHKASVSKNKTRYKGKLWNTSPPKNIGDWEEICYRYTQHIVDRYGESVVALWRFQCLNEPDTSTFFMGELSDDELGAKVRCNQYLKIYEGFVKGVRRVSKNIKVGGPALAFRDDFLKAFLQGVKKKKLVLDFISLHLYGVAPWELNSDEKVLTPKSIVKKYREKLKIIKESGFEYTPIILDEWGAASHGFYNKEECPKLMFRETEAYSAYFTRLIYDVIDLNLNIENMMICLSGQHEMTEDFSGFRNFFTLNFIRKPIYNAYVLAAKLGNALLRYTCDTPNVFAIPTKTKNGDFALLLTYAANDFSQELPDRQENICFGREFTGRRVTIWKIDKNTANPYELSKTFGPDLPQTDQILKLREEGRLKPVLTNIQNGCITLSLSTNCVYFIKIEGNEQ